MGGGGGLGWVEKGKGGEGLRWVEEGLGGWRIVGLV